MRPEQIFNFIESLIWFAIAGVFLFNVKEKIIAATARMSQFLFVAFVLFGISDLVEIRTGGWWKPWWLFLLKAFCLTSIVLSMTVILRRKATSKKVFLVF